MEVYEDRVPEAYEIAHWSVKLEASEAEQNYTGTFNLHFLTGIKMYPAVHLLIARYRYYRTGAPPFVICTYTRTRSGAQTCTCCALVALYK